MTQSIESMKETIAAQAAMIEKLREALSVVMWFVPNHPTVPENKRRFDILKEAIAIPTDSTQILEQYAKEKTQAQAAVIEKLRDRLLDVCTEIESSDVLLSHGDTKGALAGVRRTHVAASLGFSLLKRTNDSTQILDEVRRAEREKCAKVCEDRSEHYHGCYMGEEATGASSCAASIRAMEEMK